VIDWSAWILSSSEIFLENRSSEVTREKHRSYSPWEIFEAQYVDENPVESILRKAYVLPQKLYAAIGGDRCDDVFFCRESFSPPTNKCGRVSHEWSTRDFSRAIDELNRRKTELSYQEPKIGPAHQVVTPISSSSSLFPFAVLHHVTSAAHCDGIHASSALVTMSAPKSLLLSQCWVPSEPPLSYSPPKGFEGEQLHCAAGVMRGGERGKAAVQQFLRDWDSITPGSVGTNNEVGLGFTIYGEGFAVYDLRFTVWEAVSSRLGLDRAWDCRYKQRCGGCAFLTQPTCEGSNSTRLCFAFLSSCLNRRFCGRFATKSRHVS
jgi:hypothetical protein